ncbi:DUF397 domain-containing protein [Lentzea nigeriaca]|uniref:DUF397 domain-containing protein n=1 Tax=Lentzea nigeriaca TaxID=1128665 RepID=UPI00195BF944|nr:DUF397 domain-containing protein [Lentzea nigeriaca]MBM7860746.1 hypothetical protein [Lentzea nigeriaca]
MPTTWRKSSRSGNGSNCVEVTFAGDDVATRDSKNPTGPVLRFTQQSWSVFLGQAKASRFNC